MATITRRATNIQSSASATGATITKTPSASPCCCPACVGLDCLTRTRFFAGQLLTEADLNNEQAYLLAKNRLHNRYLVGSGVVCGLQVLCSPCDGWVTVKSGYAIDPCGNDIIICADQPFNVIKAIQACCATPKQTNCTPPRATPPSNCQDAEQQWCITIQYQEQPSRPVTPLQQPSSKSGSCGCGCGGSSKGGCGCGSGSSGTKSSSSSCGCSSTSAQTSNTSTTAACEPTRILESFQLGVCAAPSQDPKRKQTSLSGPLDSQLVTCLQTVEQLILQVPNFEQQQITDPNTAYSQACNFVLAVRSYISSSPITTCQMLDQINAFTITKPTQQGDQNYIGLVQSQIDSLAKIVFRAALDCFCLALLPTCPPAPCDNCLILACLTVQNGQIVDICHFGGGRQQLVTFQSLDYWLGALGLDKLFTNIGNAFKNVCCGEDDARNAYLKSGYAMAENLNTSGITNAGMVNRALAYMTSQRLGSTILNAGMSSASTVDLRPYVGQSVDIASRSLLRYKIQINPVDVSASWTPDVAAQGAQFTPSAFPAGQTATMFTQNQLVVGFEPLSPTDSLKLQVASLQAQVTALQGQINPSPESQPKTEPK